MGDHAGAVARALAFDQVTDSNIEAQSNEQTLRANDYPQDRGIFKRGAADNLNHVDFFGDCYLQELQTLGDGDTWLHVGPGDFYAEVDYFSNPIFSKHAKVISNAYCVSDSEEAKRNLELLQKFAREVRFECIGGVKFQELRRSLGCRAKLISDVFAAGSYDEDLFGFFEAASELLLPGGMLAVVLATVSFTAGDGRNIPAAEVYRSLPGFELVNSTENSGWVFRRTGEAFVKPTNELISFVARHRAKGIMWPIRRYKLL